MIHVCFALHDKDGRYSKFTGTAILSIFENTNEKVTAHILHDDTLTADNHDKFLMIAKRYGQIIKFHNVEEICAEEIARIKKMFANYTQELIFSIAKFFKFMISFALPADIEKIIYLDSDIIVNLDINELWQIPIGNKSLAAVPEMTNGVDTLERFMTCQEGFVVPEDYFNSGVMVMNLQKIRRSEIERIWDGIKWRAENPKYVWWDQEIFNYCFTKDFLKLEHKFNVFSYNCREHGDFRTNQRIFHYVQHALGFDLSDSFNFLWFSCFEKTPFFTKEIITHLYEELKEIINRRNTEHIEELKKLKNFELRITAVMSGKSRAFFADVSNIDVMKQIFYVKDDEEIIQFINQESFQLLANSMYNSCGKKIFFILFDDYSQLSVALIRAGFVEGEDFIDASIFLYKKTIEPLDTYQLVRNL